MFNIWGLLLFTINTSLVALLILILKHLFKDLLSARWQYGVWSMLILRMLVPSVPSRYVFLPVGKYVEMLKAFAERGLSSAYTDIYSMIGTTLKLPESLAPVSVTDWLFIAYCLGVLMSFAWYMISYQKLRSALKGASAVPEEIREEIKLFAGLYGLKVPRRIVFVRGISSAFICGIIKPVLVLPEDKPTDEKIILHELLHYRHKDTIKTFFHCLIRCINWFNPLMTYVFRVMDNDVEKLCDLRTLEKLEGEDRREYGRMLLGMVNEKYQKVPCTSSVSNGAENISGRIDSIVKFKKYPKGMELVSVCIILLLIFPCLVGSAMEIKEYYPESQSEFNMAVASARSSRCTTVAGALDSFAKALSQKNGIMMLLATPVDMHEEIITAMRNSEGKELYYYETGKEFDIYSLTEGYKIFNLKKADKNTYSAIIGFNFPEIAEDMLCSLYGEESDGYKNYLFVPVTVSYDGGWVVTADGERFTENEYDDGIAHPNFGVYEAQGDFGSFALAYRNEFTIDNSYYADDMSQMLGFSSFMYEPVVNADFRTVWDMRNAVYTVYEDKKADFYEKSMTLQTRKFKTVEDYEEFMKAYEQNEKMVKVFLAEYDFPFGSSGGTESWGSIDSTWSGRLSIDSGGGYSRSNIEREYKDWQPPAVEMAWVFCQNQVIDEFTIFTKGAEENGN